MDREFEELLEFQNDRIEMNRNFKFMNLNFHYLNEYIKKQGN